MNKKRRSIIWNIPSKEFKALVLMCNSYAEILRHCGFDNKGNNYKTLQIRLKEEGIDVSHLIMNKKKYQRKQRYYKKLENVLCKGIRYNGQRLITRLCEDKLIEYHCAICGNPGNWNGKKLTLTLDHIDGDHYNNTLENLRILCPNCHSQTSTFCGKTKHGSYIPKKLKNGVPKINRCLKCKQWISITAKHCEKCAILARRKAIRPALKQLERDIKELGFCGTGRKYGVSDNAIRKWFNLR